LESSRYISCSFSVRPFQFMLPSSTLRRIIHHLPDIYVEPRG
jgi:hypothetical protein